MTTIKDFLEDALFLLFLVITLIVLKAIFFCQRTSFEWLVCYATMAMVAGSFIAMWSGA